jgi:RimJ/RimL family protein N-acetyltransferase
LLERRSFKDDGVFVGTCGIDVGYAPEHARAELGYVLSCEHWGRGLMSEAGRAVICFGFGAWSSTAWRLLHRRVHRLSKGYGEGRDEP